MYRFFIVNVRQGWLTPLMQSVSDLAIPSVLLIVLITVLAFAPGRRPALTVALNFAGIMLLNQIFQFFVHRARPDGYRMVAEAGYNFPSAHAMLAMAFYGLLAWVVWRYERDRVVRYVCMASYAMVALLVGVSRIYLGAHYASDVIAGFCLSFAWLALFTTLVAPFVLPRKRTSLGLNDTVLGAADRRDRRRSKPRHFRTVRRLFSLGVRRTASKLGISDADANEGNEPSRAARTPKSAGRHSTRGRAGSAQPGTELAVSPKHHSSRTSTPIAVMTAVEPKSEVKVAAAAPSTIVRAQTDEVADLRAAATVAASAAAAARRNAANMGAGTGPITTVSPSASGAFMTRPGASGPIGVVRPVRPNSTGGLRPSATGPIPTVSTGRKAGTNAAGSTGPIAGSNPARRKAKPGTTGSFAAVRTVSPGSTGSHPPVRKAVPAAGAPGPTPAIPAPAAEPATQPVAQPKPEEKPVVDAANVQVEDKSEA